VFLEPVLFEDIQLAFIPIEFWKDRAILKSLNVLCLFPSVFQ
jgi:hypothetical protein